MVQRLEGGAGSKETQWKSSDELEAEFFAFAESGEPTAEDREAIAKRVPSLFPPSCDAVRFTPGSVVMIAALSAITAGGGAMEFSRRLQESRERTIVEQMEAKEAKASAEREKELESLPMRDLSEAFDSGARVVRSSKMLESRLTPDQREVVASAIETFPLEETIQLIAQRTGDSITVIAGANQVELIDIYTSESVHSLIETYQGPLKEDETDAIGILMNGGGVNVNGRTIYLNISKIVELAPPDNPQALGTIVQDILMHEFLHGFPHDEFVESGHTHALAAERENDLRLMFYEGMSEWMANDIMREIRGDQVGDPFPGYSDGGTATAAFYVAAIDDPEKVYSAYVSGQWKRFDGAFQARTGGVDLDTVLTVDPDHPLADVHRYTRIAGLQKMVDALGDDAWEVAARANATLDTGHITLYQDADFQAITITGDRAETGITNGVVWGTGRTILLSAVMPEGKSHSYTKTKDNIGMAFVDIGGSNGNKDSLDHLSPEERITYVQHMLSAVSDNLTNEKP